MGTNVRALIKSFTRIGNFCRISHSVLARKASLCVVVQNYLFHTRYFFQTGFVGIQLAAKIILFGRADDSGQTIRIILMKTLAAVWLRKNRRHSRFLWSEESTRDGSIQGWCLLESPPDSTEKGKWRLYRVESGKKSVVAESAWSAAKTSPQSRIRIYLQFWTDRCGIDIPGDVGVASWG